MSINIPIRVAVIEGLSDLAELTADFEVRYSWRRNWLARGQVFTANSTYESPPAALRSGRNYRDESGTFDIVVRYEAEGFDQAGTDLACETGLALVQTYLADRKSNELGVTGLQWVREESVTFAGGHTDHSTIAEAIMTVRYAGRRT